MPRKRKTKATSKRRPQAKMPEGAVGEDYEEELRQEKLRVIIRDFDEDVEARIKQMQEEATQLYKQMNTCVQVELMKIPKHIREMPVAEFLKMGGKLNAGAADEATALAMKVATSVGASVSHALQPIAEESEEVDSTLKKKRPTRGRRGALQANTSMNVPPPSTAGRRTRRTLRQSQQALMTPSSRVEHPSVADTPVITPMFDRRLPNTPATLVRNPKPGERLYGSNIQMSMHGSPVLSHQVAEPEVLLPVGRNKTLVIRDDMTLDDIQDVSINDDTVAHIRRMQELLSKICDHHGVRQKK